MYIIIYICICLYLVKYIQGKSSNSMVDDDSSCNYINLNVLVSGYFRQHSTSDKVYGLQVRIVLGYLFVETFLDEIECDDYNETEQVERLAFESI